MTNAVAASELRWENQNFAPRTWLCGYGENLVGLVIKGLTPRDNDTNTKLAHENLTSLQEVDGLLLTRVLLIDN
jgi:hypothetical protein